MAGAAKSWSGSDAAAVWLASALDSPCYCGLFVVGLADGDLNGKHSCCWGMVMKSCSSWTKQFAAAGLPSRTAADWYSIARLD